MKLIIVRHGKTIANQEKIIQGQTHGVLSEEGIEQARKVAERLKNEEIHVIFTSDLKRAADTAKEISKFHNVPFHLVKELRERSYGEFEGQKRGEIDAEKKWSDDLIEEYGGESANQASQRIINLKNKVLKEFDEKNVLFVTHHSISQFLLADLIENYEKNVLGNASVTIFEKHKDGKLYLKIFNCTKHLD